MTACPCPGRITDPVRHAQWHAEVVAAGGPAGIVNVETLRAARAPAPVADPPDRQQRARNYRSLVEDAKRNGRHAETPPRRDWSR